MKFVFLLLITFYFTNAYSQCPFAYTASSTDETVYNACDGTITITVNGGSPPFLFEIVEVGNPSNMDSITFNGTSYTFTNVCPGTYYYLVFDSTGNSCYYGGPVGNNTVTVNPAAASLSVTCIGNGGAPACSGMSGMVEANAVGDLPPFQYNFNLSTGPTGYSSSNTAYDPFICGYITVTVMDNDGNTAFAECPTQCNAPPNVQLSVTPSCFGTCSGSVNISISSSNWSYYSAWAPYDIYLTDGFSLNTYIGSISSPATILTASNICPGNYDISVVSTSMGCASIPGTNAFTINSTSQVTINSINPTNASCNGTCTGSISLSVSGGTSPYTITNTFCSNGNPVGSLTSLCADDYCLSVTDANGCQASTSPTVTITEPPLLELFVDSIHNETFPGSTDGEVFIHVLGGTPSYTFTVDNFPDFPPFNNLGAGTHTVCVMDNNGCVSCSNFTIGNSYQCNLSVNAIIQNLLCNGTCNGSINSNVSGSNGSVNYVWTPSGATTSSINNLCAGNYCVQITDSVGCVSDTCFIISSPAQINPNTNIVNVSCNGSCDGQIQLNPTGGTPPYSYSNFICSGSSSPFTNLCPGDYCPVITDSNGCVLNVGPVNVSQPPVLQLNIDSLQNETIIGANDGAIFASVTGGTGSAVYYLDGNFVSLPVTNLGSGTYTLCAEDVNFCTSCLNFTIDTNFTCNINFNASVISSTCSGMCTGECGLMNVSGNGNLLYQWNTGQTTSIISNLCDGTYCVQITDSVGCQLDTCFTLTTPVFTANYSATMVSCNSDCNGSVELNISGGPTGNYQYSADNINWVNQNAFDSLCDGNYTFYYSDSICVDSISVVITEPSPLFWTFISVTPASTQSSSDGEIYVVGSGGTVPYTYSANGGSCFNIPFGNYDVCVIDSMGCVYCDSLYVGYLTGINELTEEEFKIYPNPAKDFLTIEFVDEFSGEIIIKDVSGKIVLSQPVNKQNKINLSVDLMEKGIYFIQTSDSAKGIPFIKN